MIPEIQSETDRIFCHFGPFFALLPPNYPQNQNFEKMKKASGDVIMPFYPTIDPKTKIWKKYKISLEILSFYTCVP